MVAVLEHPVRLPRGTLMGEVSGRQRGGQRLGDPQDPPSGGVSDGGNGYSSRCRTESFHPRLQDENFSSRRTQKFVGPFAQSRPGCSSGTVYPFRD